MSAGGDVRVAQQALAIETAGRGFTRLDETIARAVDAARLAVGTAHLFCHHTSASLLITENADRAVRADLERFFARLVPDGDAIFAHDAEGPDDMPAHVRAVLTGASVTVPISDGRLALGTWQGVFLYEHRTSPHRRRLTLTLTGTAR